MLDASFAVPGDLGAPTGGYAYARKLLELAPRAGVGLRHVPLPGGFPHPSRTDLLDTARILAGAPGRVLLVDGLAYGAFTADLLGEIARPIVALVHHPLAFENGLAPARREALLTSERDALARASAVVASSGATARTLAADFAVPSAKIAVVEPGTDPAPRAESRGGPVRLVAVGAVSRRKGYDLLARALGDLRGLEWRMAIAGSLDRDGAAVADLRSRLHEARVEDRVALLGALSGPEMEALYAEADVLVSPSLYEGYGMALAEAMAHGLPLVASTGGAAADTVPDGAGLKVPPGDVPALAAALQRMIADTDLRRRCADVSWAAGQKLPRWSETAAKVAAVLRGIAS